MKLGLEIGAKHRFTYRVPETKTVRHIYSEAEEFSEFPEVFATGFLVALMEWTCTQSLQPYLEPDEGSLGIHIDMSHDAPTPPGFEVTVTATLIKVESRKLTWQIVAHDGVDEIGRGRHQRALINRKRFDAKLGSKQSKSSVTDT